MQRTSLIYWNKKQSSHLVDQLRHRHVGFIEATRALHGTMQKEQKSIGYNCPPPYRKMYVWYAKRSVKEVLGKRVLQKNHAQRPIIQRGGIGEQEEKIMVLDSSLSKSYKKCYR